MLGREVAKLVTEGCSPGTCKVEWILSDFSGGICFYHIKTGHFIVDERLFLVK
jgi:hypothetical protein